MIFECRREQNNVMIRNPVVEVELIIASEDDVEVETLDGGRGEASHEASVGLMTNLGAKLAVFIGDLVAQCSGVVHLQLTLLSNAMCVLFEWGSAGAQNSHSWIMVYINHKGDDAIRNFRYKGGNISISYQYLWSPLAELVLKIMPKSLAPNTITIIGLLIQAIGALVLIAQGKNTDPAPTWALVFYGTCVFVYQTLDNVDGKQARLLHNSTPLGMILDHGCDALGILFLTIGVGRVVMLGDFELYLWVFTLGVATTFYLSAWCQYHSQGIMVLGKFNAPDDGIPAVWMMAFISAIFGQQIWLTEVPVFGRIIPLNILIPYAILSAGVIQVYSVVKQAGDNFTKDYLRAFSDLLHIGVLTVAIYFITEHSDFCWNYFPALLVSVGFCNARTTSYTLLSSVTQTRFQQFQPAVLLFGAYPLYILYGQELIPPFWYTHIVCGLIILEYFYFMTTMSAHIAKVLNITIFSVFDPKNINKKHGN